LNINERVEIELTRHDLDLVRYQNGQIKDALSTISNLQIEIVGEIKRAEPRSKRELEQLLDRVNEAVDRTYAAMALESIESLGRFAVDGIDRGTARRATSETV
jgi:predicted transcriptional regulator